MPAPVVASHSTGRSDGNVTSQALVIPTGITAGDLLLAFCAIDSNGSNPVASGWTVLGLQAGGNAVQAVVFYRTASGGDTCTITGLDDERVAYHVLRITGWSITPTGSAASGDNTTPDSPAHDTGGAGEFVWISFFGVDGNVATTAFPAGYAGTDSQIGDSTLGASSGIAWTTTARSTEDPGPFAIDESDDWAAWTVAVAGTAPEPEANTVAFFAFF